MTGPSRRRRILHLLVLPLVVVGAVGAVGYQLARGGGDEPAPTDQAPLDQDPPHLHAVQIHEPDGPPGVVTGQLDAHGQPILANCTTCHATRSPNRAMNDGAKLKDFHTGLETNHGGLSCLSCHNADDYSSLRRADGTPVAFVDVRNLCAQCHGPQHRDYLNGSHGGMNGYWDLTRGGRTRNNCTDCHDAHAPQYPVVRPVFPPKDRFLTPASEEDAPHD